MACGHSGRKVGAATERELHRSWVWVPGGGAAAAIFKLPLLIFLATMRHRHGALMCTTS
jgi:hypothetical protein